MQASAEAGQLLLDQQGEGAGGGAVHLFGNVLPDPALFELIEQCGARVVSDDLCTGSRLIHSIPAAYSIFRHNVSCGANTSFLQTAPVACRGSRYLPSVGSDCR